MSSRGAFLASCGTLSGVATTSFLMPKNLRDPVKILRFPFDTAPLQPNMHRKSCLLLIFRCVVCQLGSSNTLLAPFTGRVRGPYSCYFYCLPYYWWITQESVILNDSSFIVDNPKLALS